MSDVNNGPGGDSNSGPIPPGVYSSPTRTVALFGPRGLFESNLNNGPSLAILESERKVAQKRT